MRVTVLLDNEVGEEGLLSQHGLSLWVETGPYRLLIDTGQDGTFLQNADRLGIDVTMATHLWLTHGHYDHTGGVPALLARGARPVVVLHPHIFRPRRSVREGEAPRSIGVPWERTLLDGLSVLDVTGPTRVLPGIWSTGSIRNATRMHHHPRLLCAAPGGWRVDSFPDEQAIVFETTAGLVVITGCCHAGLANTLLAAQTATGVTRIHTVIGGLHLHERPPDYLRRLAGQLLPYEIAALWVNHCTGAAACVQLDHLLAAKVTWANTGTRLDLPD